MNNSLGSTVDASKIYNIHRSYKARARPRTPAAPARLTAIPVGAAPPPEVVDAAEPDAEAEAAAEDEAASEPVAVEEEDESVAEVESAEDEAPELEAPELEAPEREALVEVAEAVLRLELLAPELVISAEMDDAKEG